jgi:hypothetical protein
MSEVLAIGFLKHELLKAAARKREQAARSVRPGTFERPVESKLPRKGQDERSR